MSDTPTAFSQAFQDPALCRSLLDRIEEELTGPLRFMEVCGTHTVAIFRSGLHTLLPKAITHISGPGCPVCVTHESEVAAFMDLAGRNKVIVATFGDLMRVPGPGGATLKHAQAQGARVEVVYSPADALTLARNNPDDKVVFLGVGFETTAPTIAASVKMARQEGLNNYLVLSFHKLVPPALQALLAGGDAELDAFLLPGHVSAILGLTPYGFLAKEHGLTSVVGGFEPLDILQALLTIIRQINKGEPAVLNAYPRVVRDQGNPTARAVLEEVFTPTDALWRGIGTIPGSGLALAPAYSEFDAMEVLGLTLPPASPLPGCRCGEVIKGKLLPNQCPAFGKACTPASPLGPCMVSTEGSCAAYYQYRLEE